MANTWQQSTALNNVLTGPDPDNVPVPIAPTGCINDDAPHEKEVHDDRVSLLPQMMRTLCSYQIKGNLRRKILKMSPMTCMVTF